MFSRQLAKNLIGLRQCHTPAPTMSQTVSTQRHGEHVFVITINRPEKRNAVNPRTATLLVESFRKFEDDDTYRVAVLTGAGGNFCAGFDLSFLAETGAATSDEGSTMRDLIAGEIPGLGPMGPSRHHLSKPLIAAVSGYAVAGGLELSLLADMRVADDTATFGVFCRRFGVPLIDGGSVRLPKLIGLSRAMDLILTGRPVGAPEALRLGLANRVVPTGQALDAALQLADQIACFPQDAMLGDRQSAIESTYKPTSLEEALKREATIGTAALRRGRAWDNAKGFVAGTGRHGKFDEPTSKL